MKKIIILLLLTIPIYVNSQNYLPLSEQSQVSVLTYSPGDELYSVFGHTAIRIYDPVIRLDWVYNYGTFDFDTPFFYIKFVRGNLMYQIAKADFRRSYLSIMRDDRTVYEQDLNLSLEERQQLFEALETNYLPENRYYLYNFFFDNCATRVRDMIENSTNREIRFDESTYQNKTFRQILDEYIGHSFLFDFGINILMGINADKKAEPLEYMFIPDYIMDIYGKSNIISNNVEEQFTSEPKIIYESNQVFNQDRKTSALKILWVIIIVLLGVSGFEFYKRKYFRMLDIFLFMVSGLLGLLLVILWIGSLHSVFLTNFNILWVMPTNLLVGIYLIRNKKKTWTKYNAKAGFLFIIVILICWNLLPQKFSVTFIPFMILLLARHSSFLFNYLGFKFKLLSKDK